MPLRARGPSCLLREAGHPGPTLQDAADLQARRALDTCGCNGYIGSSEIVEIVPVSLFCSPFLLHSWSQSFLFSLCICWFPSLISVIFLPLYLLSLYSFIYPLGPCHLPLPSSSSSLALILSLSGLSVFFLFLTPSSQTPRGAAPPRSSLHRQSAGRGMGESQLCVVLGDEGGVVRETWELVALETKGLFV